MRSMKQRFWHESPEENAKTDHRLVDKWTRGSKRTRLGEGKRR
jgi:hypothetical protein